MVPVRVAAGATAAAIAAAPTIVVPTVWHIFGIPFQAGPTVVCLCCCTMVRVLLFLKRKSRKDLAIDVVTTMFAGLMAAVYVQTDGSGLLAAAAYGTGFGAIGIGIIGIIQEALTGRLKSAVGVLFGSSPNPLPPPVTAPAAPLDTPADMTAHLDALDAPAPSAPYVNPYGD